MEFSNEQTNPLLDKIEKSVRFSFGPNAVQEYQQLRPTEQLRLSLLEEAVIDSTNSNLVKRLADKQQVVLILEVSSSGESQYKEMTLFDLLADINSEVTCIDDMPNLNTSTSDSKLSEHYSMDHSSVSLRKGQQKRLTGKLLHRDLRRLEYKFNPLGEPTVLVRRHAVVISLDPIRAVVMASRLILIIPDGADTLLQQLDKFINDGSTEGLTFEARAYEGILATIITLQTADYEQCNSQAGNILSEFKTASILSIERQEQMRVLKNKVSGMIAKINAYKVTLVALLDSEEDLALLNINKLKQKPSLYSLPLSPEILTCHEEMEMLLESYLIDYNSLAAKLEFLRSQIQSAEELVLLRLDTSRNQLLIADTVLSVLTLALALGGFVGSMFGMNLMNHLEASNNMFNTVFGATCLVIIVVAGGTIGYFKFTGVLPRREHTFKKYFNRTNNYNHNSNKDTNNMYISNKYPTNQFDYGRQYSVDSKV